MSRFAALYHSTLGKKVIVAVTGLMMLGFLVGHVTGNLKVFLPDTAEGIADIDEYAEFLRTMATPMLPYSGALWIARGILLIALVLHVVCVVQLARLNRAARPASYSGATYARASLPARGMMFSGMLLLAFVIFHILHFTTGTVDPANFEESKVYANLYRAFQHWPWVAVYLIGMAAVAVHLYHGAWSMFQTVGLDNPDRNRGFRLFAVVIAVALFVGFASVPSLFLAGGLSAPDDATSDTELAAQDEPRAENK